jgi:hypothetical protein
MALFSARATSNKNKRKVQEGCDHVVCEDAAYFVEPFMSHAILPPGRSFAA